MGGKHYNKVKSQNKTSIFRNILLAIFILIMIFSGVKIISWIKENKESNEIKNDIKSTVTLDESKEDADRYNIDFGALSQKNAETIAWLKVNGTNIEYPVVKTANNDFYMNHSFDRSYNNSGWVFMDYKNKFDGNDKNIVIFAHNRRDGSMFGTLKNILTDEWQKKQENFIIPLISENEKAEYKVFSVYKIEKEDYYITTRFGSDEDFRRFINIVKSRSVKDFGVEVTEKDKVLTLSTCADNNDYRVVLHAIKIKK